MHEIIWHLLRFKRKVFPWFKVQSLPFLKDIPSLIVYPTTLISETFSRDRSKGIIIGIYAHKPEERNK